MNQASAIPDSFISLREAAKILNISVHALYRLMARQELPPPVKVGGSSKLFESDITTYQERLRASRKKTGIFKEPHL